MTGATEHPALVAAARHGLGQPTARVSLEGSAAREVLARAAFDHLTGFLADAVLADVVGVTDESLLSTLSQQWHDELRICVRLEALAVRTAQLLATKGISWRLTKGAALAHLDYPDPAIRTFGDIDLIIHPDDWSGTLNSLAAKGYRRQAPTLSGRYDHHYGKGATLTAPEGLQVDLHRRFAVGRFGVTSRMEDLFTSSETIELAGLTIPVLNPAGRLLHACFHAALGGFRRLRAFRDVAQLIVVTGADWEETFSVARSWKAEAVVASAIKESWDRLALDLTHPAHARAISTTMSRADQRVLELFGREASFRSKALSALVRLPPYEMPRYLWSLGRPKLRRSS